MKILVTGATGNVGSQVVKQLSAKGVPTRAMVRNRDKSAALAGPHVELVVGDLEKPDTLDAALAGVERVLLSSAGDPRQVELQHNLIEAAKRAKAERLVKISALGAAQDTPINLGRWHWQTEQELIRSGLAYTILQPHFFMQNLLGFAATVAAEGKIYAPMKDGKVGVVDARDIAAVAVAALTEGGHAGQTYLITGPEALSFADLAEKIGQAIGKPVTYVDIPPEAAQQGMLGFGMPEWLVSDMLGLYGAFSAGYGELVTPVVADVAKKQPITFDQFARDYAQVFKGN